MGTLRRAVRSQAAMVGRFAATLAKDDCRGDFANRPPMTMVGAILQIARKAGSLD